MKQAVQICILLGMALLVIGIYFHLYETSSTGLLPYIDYPLRPYALPLLILTVISRASGTIIKLHREAQ